MSWNGGFWRVKIGKKVRQCALKIVTTDDTDFTDLSCRRDTNARVWADTNARIGGARVRAWARSRVSVLGLGKGRKKQRAMRQDKAAGTRINVDDVDISHGKEDRSDRCS